MARKPPNFEWLGMTQEQRQWLNHLDFLGDNSWDRNSQADSAMPQRMHGKLLVICRVPPPTGVTPGATGTQTTSTRSGLDGTRTTRQGTVPCSWTSHMLTRTAAPGSIVIPTVRHATSPAITGTPPPTTGRLRSERGKTPTLNPGGASLTDLSSRCRHKP
jgi:hypothetical protein